MAPGALVLPSGATTQTILIPRRVNVATTTSKKPDVKADAKADTVEATATPDADATPNTYHEHAAANGCVGG